VGFFRLNTVPRMALFGCVSFLVLYPLAMMLIGSFRTEMPGLPGKWGLAGWIECYSDPAMFKVIWTTVKIAVAKTVLAVVIAVIFSWAIHRTNMPGRQILDTALYLNFFIMPPLPVILGWVLLFSPKTGVINQWFSRNFGSPLFDIFSMSGIVFVMLSFSISFYYMFLSPSFKSMDITLEEAARTSGASGFQTLRKIVLPLLMPAILAATMLSFIRGMEAFEAPFFLGARSGINVLSTKIFDYINLEPSNYMAALSTGVTLLAITFGLVVLQWKLLGTREFVTVTGKGYRPRLMNLGMWRWPVFILLAVFLGCLTLPPLIILIQTTFMKIAGFYELPGGIWTMDNYREALSHPDILKAIKNTIILALSVATIAILLSTLVAYVVVKTRFAERKALDLIAWLPWAVPGIVMSLALLWAWIFIKPFGFSLYGSLPLVIICMITVSFPIGTRIMASNMIQISKELEESARVSGASWTQSLLRIWLPLLKNGLMNGWILNFTASVRVLAPVILLFGPQSIVISTIFYEFWSRGNIEMASVVGVLQSVIIVVGYTFIKLMGSLGGIKTEEETAA